MVSTVRLPSTIPSTTLLPSVVLSNELRETVSDESKSSLRQIILPKVWGNPVVGDHLAVGDAEHAQGLPAAVIIQHVLVRLWKRSQTTQTVLKCEFYPNHKICIKHKSTHESQVKNIAKTVWSQENFPRWICTWRWRCPRQSWGWVCGRRCRAASRACPTLLVTARTGRTW